MSALAQTVSSTERVVAQRGFSWTRLLRAGSLVATVVTLLVGAILGEPQAIATAVLGFAIGLGIVALFFRGSDRAFLVTLFLVAFAGRTVTAVASHFVLIYLGRGGFMLLDDRAYDKLGWGLARVWMGIYPGVRDTDEYLLVNYTYLIAIVYYLLGHSLLAAKMFNVAFGSILAVVLYGLAAQVTDRRAAQVTALLTAFFPSLFVWSVLNFKDTMVVLFASIATLALLRYARQHDWWALLIALGAFAGLENLRQWVFFILAWLMPVAFVFADRSRLPRKAALLIPLVVGIYVITIATHNPSFGVKWLTPQALTQAEWARWLAEKNALTGIDEEPIKPLKDPTTIFERSIAYLPKGVLYVLFGPFPWEARSALARAVIPEMLAWYALLAAAAVGLAVRIRSAWRELLLPMGFTAAWILALALTEGNTGNIFRHRSMFMPFVFLLSGVGAVWLWDFWQTRRASSARAVGVATA